MGNLSRETLLPAYAAVMSSFIAGAHRLWRAEAASARLNLALLAFHAERHHRRCPDDQVFRELSRIPYESHDALYYVTDVSHLVYATTLLDTFLTDTTQFMLLLFPEAIGKNAQVPLKSLMAGQTLSAVITEEAAKRAREVSYQPFPARVEYLRSTFGLTINIAPVVTAALDHYPTVRNSAVHDQGIFELLLESEGHVIARRKTCPQHPTKVNGDDVANALRAYQDVFATVANAVVTQVLKCPGHSLVAELLRPLAREGGATSEKEADSGTGVN